MISNKPVLVDRKPHALHPLSLMFECISLARRNIIPAVFAGFSAASGGLIGLWIAMSIFAVAIAVAVFKYFTFRYCIDGNQLIIDHGLIFRQHRTIPISRIQNIDLVQNPLHRFFAVGEVKIETASGKEPEAIMRVLAVSELNALRMSVFGLQHASHTLDNASSSTAKQKSDHDTTETHSSTQQESNAEIASQSLTRHHVQAQSHGITVPVYNLPTKLLIFAGLLSNRGMVMAGLFIGFLWQMQLVDRLGLSPDKWIQRNGGDLSEAIVQDRDVVRGLARWMSGHVGVWQSILAITLGFIVLFLLLRLLSAAWYVLRFYGYTLVLNGNDFRVQCGLFTKVAATIPRDRIQLISIHRPVLSRRFKLASIRIETAGGGDENEDAAATVGRRWFLPVIREQDVTKLVQLLRPDISFDEKALQWQPLSPRAAARIMRLAIPFCFLIMCIGVYLRPTWGWSVGLALGAFVVWYARKKSKSRRYARTDWGVAFRSGILYHKFSITFFDRIQSVQLDQSPFDRRWKMATLRIDTTAAGPADHVIAVEMLDADFATQEFRATSCCLKPMANAAAVRVRAMPNESDVLSTPPFRSVSNNFVGS